MQCEYQAEGSVQECHVGTVSLAWDGDRLQRQSKWRAVIDSVACRLSRRGQARGDRETGGEIPPMGGPKSDYETEK